MTAAELIAELKKLDPDHRLTIAIRTYTQNYDVAYVDVHVSGNVIFACLPEGYVVSKRNMHACISTGASVYGSQADCPMCKKAKKQ